MMNLSLSNYFVSALKINFRYCIAIVAFQQNEARPEAEITNARTFTAI